MKQQESKNKQVPAPPEMVFVVATGPRRHVGPAVVVAPVRPAPVVVVAPPPMRPAPVVVVAPPVHRGPTVVVAGPPRHHGPTVVVRR